MTENERLKIFRKSLNKTQSEFGAVVGLQQGSYADVERGKVKVSGDIKTALNKEFSLNVDWLESEKGEMTLKKNGNTKSLGEINYPFEAGDTPFIDLGEGKLIMIVPLVNEYAYGGYLAGYKDPEFLDELPKHTIIVDKYHKGTYRAFEVVGDSMDDNTKESIPDGCIVTAREIQHHLWSSKFHTHRFKDYVIVHKKYGIITKRITNHDTNTGIITCHSLNPDKVNYADFEIHLDDVKQMFNVVNVLLKR